MIREAKETDLPQILAIYNDAILNTTAVYSYKPQDINERETWFKHKSKKNYPILVWEQKGEIAGFATFGPFRDWPAYQYSIEHSIYVHKDYRRKGIATSLLKALIKLANDRGYKTLIAGIDAANEQSIAMHQKLGFIYAGGMKNVGYKFNQWLDLTFYQLPLNGPKKPSENMN